MEEPRKKRNSRLKESEFWKREKYKQDLALMVYDANKMTPTDEFDELKYEGRARGFLIVPDEFTFCGNHLTHGEKITWLALFQHNWDKDPTYRVSWAGRERLAIMLGVSTRQITTYLKGLREKKLLISRKRMDNSSLHVLFDPPAKWMKETLEKLDEWKRKKIEEKKSR